MPANISNVFDIVVDETLNTAGTVSVEITNPGRTFRVVGMYVTGDNGGQVVLTNSTTGTTIASNAALATPFLGPTAGGSGGDYGCSLNGTPITNMEVAADQNLTLTAVAAADVTRMVIKCEASNPQAITVTP
jgi:hypothetical protein